MKNQLNQVKEIQFKSFSFNPTMLFVLFLSVIVRLTIQHKYAGARFYYPDSWDYVVVPSQLGPPRSFHPPTIWKFWEIFTFGSLSESSVLILQAFLGVITTLMVFKILSRFLTRGQSLMLTMIYILTPWQYFFERTFLPESVSLFLLILLFSISQRVNLDKGNLRHVKNVVLVSLILGLLVALKPLYSLFAFSTLAILIVRIFLIKHIKMRTKYLISTLIVLVACIPMASLSVAYFKSYQVFSTSPASGSFLITRWANLVPCTSYNAETNEIVRNVVKKVCEKEAGMIPGESTNLLYLEPDVGATLQAQKDFAYIQQRLQMVAAKAVLANIDDFIPQLVRAFIYPFVTISLPNDLSQFKGGGDFSGSSVIKDNFVNYKTWFDVKENLNLELTREEQFRSIMLKSINLPTLLFFITIGLLFISIPIRIRKNKKLGLHVRFRSFRAVLESEYIIVMTFVISTQFMIAATSVINFRLYLNFIPIWIILVGKIISGLSLRESEPSMFLDPQQTKAVTNQ